ncbi:integrase [Gossypium australe]|uniref:Integrase n=1 Tax=Gossypium australe TaxID=47621 RepID=A0A5B6VDL8_9ROSI|nr:integrase [Gossypium australe]
MCCMSMVLSITSLALVNFVTRDSKLGHASMSTISKLIKNELLVGMPNFPIEFNKVCDAYAKRKHMRAYFKSKNTVSTSKVFQLIHIDLFRPTRTMNLGGKQYVFVIVDDYSRYTRKNLLFFCKMIQNQVGYSISSGRSDHGKEFENLGLDNFCNKHGISHNFSAPRTP